MPLPDPPARHNRAAAWSWTHRALHTADSIAVITGSGISAATGLHTYRSPGSPWPDIADLQHRDTYQQHLPTLWRIWNHVRATAAASPPTPAHRALTALQTAAHARGATLTVLTQNVDGLHDKAATTGTVELHGSLHRVRCTSCSTTTDYTPTHHDRDAIPRCTDCTQPLRPDIVLFGEQPHHPDTVIATLTAAELLLVIGTSGTVHPVSSLPAFAAAHGARPVLINNEAWPDMSAFTLGFGGDCQHMLPALTHPPTRRRH